MRLSYDLEDAGWATVTVECGEQKVQMTASYLHDSLRELVSAARALVSNVTESTVVFMDEPGEHQMVLRRISDEEVDLEILWYDDWQSWKCMMMDQVGVCCSEERRLPTSADRCYRNSGDCWSRMAKLDTWGNGGARSLLLRCAISSRPDNSGVHRSTRAQYS